MMKLEVDEQEPVLGLACSAAQAPETLPAGVSNSSPLDETQPVLVLLFPQT